MEKIVFYQTSFSLTVIYIIINVGLMLICSVNWQKWFSINEWLMLWKCCWITIVDASMYIIYSIWGLWVCVCLCQFRVNNLRLVASHSLSLSPSLTLCLSVSLSNILNRRHRHTWSVSHSLSLSLFYLSDSLPHAWSNTLPHIQCSQASDVSHIYQLCDQWKALIPSGTLSLRVVIEPTREDSLVRFQGEFVSVFLGVSL